MEKVIVADTSSLIFISKLSIFPLAKNMFSKIIVTSEVLEEINKKEDFLIKKEIGNFIQEVKAKKIIDLPLGAGEKSCISYCLENGKSFLTDDKKARKFARNLGLECVGVLGILLWNLRNKKITLNEFKNLLNHLIKGGFYISSSLYDEIMKE